MDRGRPISFAAVVIAMALVAAAQAQAIFDATAKPVTAEDLRKEIGLDIYAFHLAVPEWDTFSFAVLTVSPDGKETVFPLGMPFSKLPGESPSLRLSLFRRSSLRGLALLSQDPELDLNVTLTGCNGGGFGTIIPNPTADIPGTEKMVCPGRTRQDDRLHLVEVQRKAPDGRYKLAAAIIITRSKAK